MMMPTPQELEQKFWKAIKSDMTVMLGLDGVEECHPRPMTAQLDGDEGPLWFFTAKDTALGKHVGGGSKASIQFASKGHDIFASLDGILRVEQDKSMIDRLWNPFVAAWYEGGKSDPKLLLLRFDGDNAEIWENASSLMAGIKILLGVDPKKEYRDKVASVRL